MQRNKPDKINFDEIKPQLLQALRTKSKLVDNESVSLVDGFVSNPISMELSRSITLGGPMMPLVMLVGNESGQVYFFALKALIPNIEL